MTSTRCAAMKPSDNKRCRKTVQEESVYCSQHHKMFVLENLSSKEVEMGVGKRMQEDAESDGGGDLAKKIEVLEASIAELTETVKNLTIKKNRKRSPLSKAKILYYHDHKTHPNLIAELNKRQVPFVMKTKKEADGTSVTYPSYHWLKIKKITDEAFNNLSEKERDAYISKIAV